jgi:hypothetical protein
MATYETLVIKVKYAWSRSLKMMKYLNFDWNISATRLEEFE